MPALVADVKLPELDGEARLEEADSLWPPARKLAQRIEFPRALPTCEARVLGMYRTAAAPLVGTLMAGVRQYIGQENVPRPDNLDKHGTQYEWLAAAEEQLDKIGEHLRKRFADFTQQSGSDRSQLLSPKWSEKDYNEQINKQLANAQGIGYDAAGKCFHWANFERKFFTQLLADRPRDFGPNMANLAALLVRWFKRQGTCSTGDRSDCRDPGRCLPRVSPEGGVESRGYYRGCVIDLLEIGCPTERPERIDRFICTSEPYLPMEIQMRAEKNAGYKPVPSNLLGLKEGDIANGDVSKHNREKLERDIDEWAGDARANLLNVAKLPDEKTSLVLCREVWGVPLQFYDNL